MKIAVVTCYHDPDYVRARSLRAAVAAQPGVKCLVIKNKSAGLKRYIEVLWQMLKVKFKDKPAAFLLTFRGQEILPFALLVAGRTPLWFDEFVVPSAYTKKEKHRLTPKVAIMKTLLRLYDPFYNLCLRRCSAILADTQVHAELGARLARVNLRKYMAVPVGTDETLFKPNDKTKKVEPFQVFYYTTNMQPLHGIPYVLEAAELLKDDTRIRFLLAGGKKPMATAVARAVKNGANIDYRPWIDFNELPKIMRQSGVSLGGPFGGTAQAENVITGKSYQSIACAVPTLVGANPATEAFFSDENNSLIVQQKNAEAIAAKIVWAIEHPTELRHIGEKGRRLYEREFSNEAIARIIAPLINSVRQ